MQSNPLPDILEQIPYELAVLDGDFFDTLNSILLIHDKSYKPSNAYVRLLLVYLQDNGLILFYDITDSQIPGKITLIKKLTNG